MNEERRGELIARCAAYGLDAVDIRQHGVLLEVVPASLNDLPSPDMLRAIADDLGGDGIRYVALALEEVDA